MNISFVYPTFLFALFLIAIPIIVHLFDFRRFKKVFFTNVAFLKELREETASTSRLKHLLVLLSRILVFTFLVLAFAQPYIPTGDSGKMAVSRMVSVYVDNSFSMESVSREGTLLDIARNKAATVATAFRPSDRFQLVTNNFDPAHQRLVSREEFLSMLQEIKPSSYSRKLSEISKRQQDLLHSGQADEKLAFVISDFQTKMVDVAQMLPDSAVSTYLMPVEAGSVSNAFVDSVWLASPVVKTGDICQFSARIRNAGALDLEAVPVNLVIEGTRKSVATCDIAAGDFADVSLSFTPDRSGWVNGHVEITDNPVTFDDRFYISVSVTQQLNILCINDGDENGYLQALFGNDPFFKYSEQELYKLDYSSLSTSDLVVLSEIKSVPSGLTAALKFFTEKGGTVVFIPDSAADLQSVSGCLTTLGGVSLGGIQTSQEMTVSLALEDPLFEGVFSTAPRSGEQADLPRVTKYFIPQGKTGTSETLMKLRSGNPLLTRNSTGKGALYVFTVPFSGSFSNLSRHAIFVPVMYRMALLSRHQGPLAYTLGKDDYITIPETGQTGDPVFHLVKPEGGFDIIPSVRNTGSSISLGVSGQVIDAGNYSLLLDNKPVRTVAFNFNRDESLLKFHDMEKLEELSQSAGLKTVKTYDASRADIVSGVSAFSGGISLWKYCIILALVFLTTEMLLLKFWKR